MEGKSRVNVFRDKIVERGAGGRRKEVRIACSVGGMVVVMWLIWDGEVGGGFGLRLWWGLVEVVAGQQASRRPRR